MAKHTQTIRWRISDEILSVFDHFVKLALKGLMWEILDPKIFTSLENKRYFEGALSCLRQFLVTESPLQMIKNTFYFTLKVFFVLKIFKLLS